MDYNSLAMAVTTTCGSLPIEVLELIVDEVSAERLTLGSCLSASRSFRHCSLRHLYKNVEIVVEKQSHLESVMARISALSQIISPPSSLDIEGVGRYIKAFILSFQPRLLGPFWNPVANLTEVFQLIGNEKLLAVIRSLSGDSGYGVQQFYLHVIPHRHINLAELPKEFWATFQALTQSPYLKTLQVQNMTFLSDTQRIDGPYLMYIRPEIEHSESSSKQSFDIGLDVDTNQLDKLYTDHSFPHNNISPKVLRSLKKLVTYDGSPDDDAKTWEIVQMAALSLRTLSIYHSNSITRTSDLSYLGHTPNLEHFSYIQSRLTPISQNASGFISDSEMIHRLLQVKQPMRFLKTLDFAVAVNSVEVGALYLDPNAEDLWKSLDFLLAGEHYPSLSKIRLDFHIYVIDTPHAGTRIEALTRSLEEKFPCLSSSPKISFKMDVRALKL